MAVLSVSNPASPLIGTDGWVNPSEAWTFASSTTINVPNGALYQKGDKIKLVQSATTKYFYVVGVSGNVITVVSQDANNTVTVANSAISGNFFSREENPASFPIFTSTLIAFTGFSAPPTYSARFTVIGNVCTLYYTYGSNGTSNGTGFTIINLPVASTVSPSFYGPFNGADGGANIQTITMSIAGTTLTLSKNPAGGGTDWTNTGAKAIYSFNIAWVI